MKIFVKVKPNSKKEKVERVDDFHFIVSVKEPPKEGKANGAIEASLARYFGISRMRVMIVSGHKSKIKTLNIGQSLAKTQKLCYNYKH